MASTEDIGGFLQENKEMIRDYVDTRAELFKLQAVRMAARTVSMLAVVGIVAMLALFVVLFLGMSLSFWLSAVLNNQVAGFAITGGLFVLLLAIVILLRKPLFLNPLVKAIIRETLSEGEGNISE